MDQHLYHLHYLLKSKLQRLWKVWTKKYDCIQVLYPTSTNNINLHKVLEPKDEVVEEAVDDQEARVIDTYQPVVNEEWGCEVEPPPARTTHITASEILALYKFQAGAMN